MQCTFLLIVFFFYLYVNDMIIIDLMLKSNLDSIQLIFIIRYNVNFNYIKLFIFMPLRSRLSGKKVNGRI